MAIALPIPELAPVITAFMSLFMLIYPSDCGKPCVTGMLDPKRECGRLTHLRQAC